MVYWGEGTKGASGGSEGPCQARNSGRGELEGGTKRLFILLNYIITEYYSLLCLSTAGHPSPYLTLTVSKVIVM